MHVKHLIKLRANRIHTSALVLLAIVNKLQDRHQSAYLGEITAMYSKHDPSNYQYKSIYSMLTRMMDRDLVKVDKHGQYNTYELTKKGMDLVETFREKAY